MTCDKTKTAVIFYNAISNSTSITEVVCSELSQKLANCTKICPFIIDIYLAGKIYNIFAKIPILLTILKLEKYQMTISYYSK